MRRPTDFAYANLAIRGRLLQQISDEQVDPALELKPDLDQYLGRRATIIIRPGHATRTTWRHRFESMVERLRSDGATVVMFNGPDIGMTPVLSRVRGKVAIYNENLRAIAQRHDAIVADMWALRELKDPRMWAPDRLHFSPIGHHTIARMVLDALNVQNDLEPFQPEPLPRVPMAAGAGRGHRLGARVPGAVGAAPNRATSRPVTTCCRSDPGY